MTRQRKIVKDFLKEKFTTEIELEKIGHDSPQFHRWSFNASRSDVPAPVPACVPDFFLFVLFFSLYHPLYAYLDYCRSSPKLRRPE